MHEPDPAWVREQLGHICGLPRSCAREGAFRSTVAEPTDWSRAAQNVFVADLASYASVADQVTFQRLARVMRVFPAGFRTWWVRDARGTELPAGYAAWHPVSQATWSLIAKAPSSLLDRTLAPQRLQPGIRPFVHVFNYSVVPAFRKTALSRALVKTLASELADVSPAGLCAFAVSEDGCRIAEGFGMVRTGVLRSGEYAFAHLQRAP